MAKVYEYILRLQDQASTALNKVGAATDSTNAKAITLNSTLKTVTGSLGMMGVGFGMFQVVNVMKQGIEKAHELHQAEAALKNTMQNMGTYTEAAYEKAFQGSKKMASGIDYSTSKILSLQSQLRLVGTIGENEMQRMITASADTATKLGMDLNDAGNTIAKAVNNPEMMRRLGMQLKIDPAAVDHIQKLAKHGHEAAARLELLGIIEQKVGGAAKAAFDADPLAKYNKIVGSMKMSLGEIVISLQEKLAPILEYVAGKVKTGYLAIKYLYDQLRDGNPFLWAAITAFTVYQAIVTLAAIKTAVMAWYTGISTSAIIVNTLVTEGWSAAWLALNMVMAENPIIFIITAIALLVAAVIYAWNKFGWFRGAIYATWEAIKGFGLLIKDFIVDRIKGVLNGLGGLGKALLQFFSGDWKNAWQTAKTASADLLGVNALSNAVSNAKELGSKIGSAYHKGVAEVDEKKRKAGIADKGIAGAALPGLSLTDIANKDAKASANQSTKAVASGGTRNTSIVIHLGKLVETISFAGGMKENAQDLTQQVEEALMRVLYSAESAS